MANTIGNSLKWETMKPMPTKRVFSTPVEVGGVIYIVGGCDQRGTPLDSFESYDPQKNKWNRLSSMPTKRAGPCVVAVEKKIFVFGGVAVNQQPLDCVELYDIDTKQWSTKESMKEPLLGLSAVARDGKVHVLGGMSTDTNPRDSLMTYDIENDRWEKLLDPMPTARYATFSFLIDNKLYVIGGRQGKTPVAAFEVFDFETLKWRTLPNIPSKRVFALYYATSKHIFSMGGLKENPQDGFSDAAESFDLEKETWKLCTPMPTKRGDFAIGYVGNKMIAAGGLGNQGSLLSAADSYDFETDTWTTLSSIPTPHCSCAHMMFKEKLYIFGGLSQGGLSGAVEVLGVKPVDNETTHRSGRKGGK